MKEIIALDVHNTPGGDLSLNYLFWIPVASVQQVIQPSSIVSAWTGASGAENAALQSGAVIEERYNMLIPQGTTKAAVESGLVGAYNARVSQFNTRINPNQYYGVYYDPSVIGWSA